MDLIFKIRSYSARSDLKNKQKTAENTLFLRSDLTVQDRILKIRSLASLGRLQSHPPVTGVLKWEILESALGSAPEGAPGNRGAPGSAPERVLRETGGAPGSAPESALSVDAPH